MGTWWVVLVLIAGCAVSAAQFEPRSPAPADLVSYAAGIPLSAEQVDERSSGAAGGRSLVTRSKVFRDYSGRMRVEGGSGSPNESYVFLIDPSSGTRVVMSTKDKVAYRLKGAKQGESGFAYGAAGLGDALPPGHWVTSVEDLGRRVIGSLEVEGQRITQTSLDDPPAVATYERWYSQELKVTVSATASGPVGTHAARLQNLEAGEPDPALFSVPAGYKVIDLNPGTGLAQP
jgi:hypothetical protein